MQRLGQFFASALTLSFVLLNPSAHAAGSPPAHITLCHQPGTPAEKTLVLPETTAKAHLGHGDRLGSCTAGEECAAPPPLVEVDPGTEPFEEDVPISETIAILDVSTASFHPAGAPVTFRLSCPNLAIGPDTVIVYDNGDPVPFESLIVTESSVTLPMGVDSGRHELTLLAQDVYEYMIEATFEIWAGTFSVPVVVIDENGTPVAGAQVVATLADDPDVSATLTTDSAGQGVFGNLPNRSYNIVARASGNRIATHPSSVFDGLAVLRLQGFDPPSPIDNNDFALGTDGWNIGNAPVVIVPHIEDSPFEPIAAAETSTLTASAVKAPRERSEAASATAAANLLAAPESSVFSTSTALAADTDLDLVLNTSGEGQQSISRAFDVEPGFRSVTVRFRFITSEVPGGWFGSEFNDFYNVSVRSVAGGGVVEGNSMNGLGLAAFDTGGATGWFESELPVDEQGDSVQVNIAVANVADGLFDSQVVVDLVQKKRLTISALQLRDIDNTALQYLSASNHTYFSGNTRVHGTITVEGPADESLEELTLEVIEGRRIAVGQLAQAPRGTLLTQFGSDEQVRIGTSQLLFEIPGSQLQAANQSTNGQLTLRARARSSSGEQAQRDFGPVTKLVRYADTNRYGERDPHRGGDDWAKPRVRVFIDNAGQTWGDFSNMNGGSFAPDHTSHQTGNSADGWFSGYNNRNAAVAATILGHLNTHGRRIRTVYVTFSPGSAFANAIANVTLDDGRRATDVIRNFRGHTGHFHWEVTD